MGIIPITTSLKRLTGLLYQEALTKEKRQSVATKILESNVTETHNSANTLTLKSYGSHTQTILSVVHHAHCMTETDSVLSSFDMKVKSTF